MTKLSSTEAATPVAPAAEGEALRLHSLAELYDRFGARAFGLALALTGDRGTAERVVASSFTAAWQDLQPSPRSRDAFVCLMTTVRSSALAHRRTHPTGMKRGLTSDAEHGAVGVVRALQQLPEPHRRVLELAYFRGLGVADIAAEVHEPISAVKTQLDLALRSMRSLLQARNEQVIP